MFCGSETANVSPGKGESEERSGESRKPHFHQSHAAIAFELAGRIRMHSDTFTGE